jgi:hypothetical protein
MGDLADEVAGEVDQELSDQELAVLKETSTNLEALRPQIANQVTYDALISAVETSTAKNESLAQLKARIEALGGEAVTLAQKVSGLIRA